MSPRWKRVGRGIWEIEGSGWSGSVGGPWPPNGWSWSARRNKRAKRDWGWAPTLLLAQLAVEEYVFGRRGKR